MKLNLPENVSSRQDLKEVILEIRKYAQWFSQNSVKQQYSGDAQTEPPPISAEAKAVIEQFNDEAELTEQGLTELINALSEFEETAPNAVITLAAAPSASLKKELIGWFRKNVDEGMLVDFKFNSTILGGMVVNYGSHIFDWSFKKQIMSERQKFPELLRHV